MTPKTILISGAMGGVGSAVAELFIAKGYRAALLHHHSTSEVARKQDQFGNRAIYIQCDIAKLTDTQRAVDTALDFLGSIDVCVHTAVDPIVRKQLSAMSDSEYRSAFEAGVFGAFNLFTSVLPSMRQAHTGTIIGITSVVAEMGGGGARMGAYTTAKLALRGLLRELHRELVADNIRVFAVAPDVLKTGLTADLPEKYFEFAAQHRDNKNLMTTQEVAEAVMRVVKGEIPSGSSFHISEHRSTLL